MVVPQWFIDFSAYPQLVKQYCQLPCNGNNRSLLCIFASALSQPHSPTAQIAILSKRTVTQLIRQGEFVVENVKRAIGVIQQRAAFEIKIYFLAVSWASILE